jgi:hypothetical protein
MTVVEIIMIDWYIVLKKTVDDLNLKHYNNEMIVRK